MKKTITKAAPVRKRNYLHGEPVTKKIIIGLTETQHKKLMRKIGTKTITVWFKKLAKL